MQNMAQSGPSSVCGEQISPWVIENKMCCFSHVGIAQVKINPFKHFNFN